MSQDALLSVRDLQKYYGSRQTSDVVKAVDYVTFDLPEDCTLGLVGESGCGKTTLGKCILRLVDVTAGEIVYRDTDISKLSLKEFRPYRQDIQAVFQNPHDALNPRMRVGRLLEEPFRLWGDNHEKANLDEKIRSLLRLVNLPEDITIRFPHQLSGGQLQRICIAIAIANNPRLIILDEPTTSLDAESSADLIDLLIGIKAKMKNSYIFISHDLHAVRDICDVVAVMYLGRIIEMGPKEQVFSDPCHPYTKALVGAMLRIDKDPEEIVELKGEVPSPINLPEGCHFYSRCSERCERCSQQYPDRTTLSDGRYVHCWRAQERHTVEKERKKHA